MPETKAMQNSPGNDAVIKATGKDWSEWFRILDKAGGKKKNHKEIVAIVSQYLDSSMWWQQMVTVQYEFERGLREKHQKPDGYQISRSKTINAPAAVLFDAFVKSSVRKKWLKDPEIKISSATEGKSLRGKWKETIALDVNFFEKGGDKTQVVIQNNKVKSLTEAEKLKGYWEQALLKLSDTVK